METLHVTYVCNTAVMNSMLEIVDYSDEYDEDIKKLDELMYLEIKYHGDVVEESICLALYDGVFAGIGFLIAGSTFRQIDNRELPYYHLHAEYKAVTDTDYEVQVSQEILEDLKISFCDIRKRYPDKRLILRLWCGGSEAAYMEFLMYHGFRPMKVTPIMLKSLDGDIGLKINTCDEAAEYLRSIDESLVLREIKPQSDEKLMREYMRTNGGAFGVEDSEDELIFRLYSPDSHIFAVMQGDKVVASVTVWKVTRDRAATENIFCDENFRNRGITTAMLGYTFDYLRKSGFHEASLTVFGDNITAVRLYIGLGYEIMTTLIEMHYETDYVPVQF